MRNCCVPTCSNGYETGELVSFHRFPFRNKPLLSKWIAAVNRKNDWQPSKWSCICSAHFKENDFIPHQRTPRLRDDAYPCIFSSTESQVKKKLAPDGRYDMQCESVVSPELQDQSSALEEQYEMDESSVIQTESAVFLQCDDEESSLNEIFFKTEAEDETDVFSTDSKDVLANTDFCEANQTFDFANSNSTDDSLENGHHIISEPFQLNVAEVNENEIFVCNYCNKIFDEKSHIRKHILIHMSKYFCVLCDAVFEQQYDLVSHEQEHLSGGKKFTCLICKKNLSTQFNLNLHEKIHRYVKNCAYMCKMCKVNLPSKKILVKHMTMHLHQYFYTCDDCGKTFTRKRHLLHHMTIHENQKEHICKICQKSFAHRSSLTAHAQVHVNSTYNCKHCLRAFPLKSNLIVHELQHTNKPPFNCPFCKDLHQDEETLLLHIRQYLGEKPFVCAQCGDQFFERGKLIQHQKMHIDIRPYTCPHCDEEFYTNDTLIPHLQIHPKGMPFSCQHCSRTFDEKAELTRHMRNYHRIEQQKQVPDNQPQNHTALRAPEQNNQFVFNLKSRFKLLLNPQSNKSTNDGSGNAIPSVVSRAKKNSQHSALSTLIRGCKEESNPENGLSFNDNVVLFPEMVKDELILIKSEPED